MLWADPSVPAFFGSLLLGKRINMASKSGNAFALTMLCPILPGSPPDCGDGMEGQSHAARIRYQLQQVHVNQDSPMARVPNTYLCRFYLLDDVPYQGKSAYLE